MSLDGDPAWARMEWETTRARVRETRRRREASGGPDECIYIYIYIYSIIWSERFVQAKQREIFMLATWRGLVFLERKTIDSA